MFRCSDVLHRYVRVHGAQPVISLFLHRSQVNVYEHLGICSYNTQISGHNYYILRTGCFPFVKYYCLRGQGHSIIPLNNILCNFIKLSTMGVPQLVYGLTAQLMTTSQALTMPCGRTIDIYSL